MAKHYLSGEKFYAVHNWKSVKAPRQLSKLLRYFAIRDGTYKQPDLISVDRAWCRAALPGCVNPDHI